MTALWWRFEVLDASLQKVILEDDEHKKMI